MSPLYGTGQLPIARVCAGSQSLRAPATGGAIATDTFTRADGNLSGSSTETGSKTWSLTQLLNGTTATVTSNQAKVANTGGSSSYALINCGVADHDVTITFATLEANCALMARFVDTNNFVMVQYNGSVYQLYRRVSSTYTQIGSNFTGTPANGDVIRLVAKGTLYTAYVNGVQKISTTDATANTTGTSVGMQGTGLAGANRFDSFSVSAS